VKLVGSGKLKSGVDKGNVKKKKKKKKKKTWNCDHYYLKSMIKLGKLEDVRGTFNNTLKWI
jgi:hypothetical protein